MCLLLPCYSCYSVTEKARTVIEKIDEMRETYVKKYAKTSRYDTRNYDLVITADGKKEEEIAEYILQFLE